MLLCIQCGNESARTDTYLDIPLAIRPFGENKAFGSVVSIIVYNNLALIATVRHVALVQLLYCTIIIFTSELCCISIQEEALHAFVTPETLSDTNQVQFIQYLSFLIIVL